MAQIELRMICPQCQGDGWYGATHGPGGQGDIPCAWKDCAGTGYISFGYVEGDGITVELDPSTEDLQDKHQDILDKLEDIKELIEDL